MYTIDENWGAAPERIREYFFSLPGAEETENGCVLGSVRIELEGVPALAMNRWPITRTHIVFSGEEAEVKSVHHGFFMHFISAGG